MSVLKGLKKLGMIENMTAPAATTIFFCSTVYIMKTVNNKTMFDNSMHANNTLDGT
jgi:hypothetical protein